MNKFSNISNSNLIQLKSGIEKSISILTGDYANVSDYLKTEIDILISKLEKVEIEIENREL